MLIPIRKRTFENLIDEVGELQADVAALEAKLKKKKAALKEEMHHLNVANAQGKRFQVTYVTRRGTKVDWPAIREVVGIEDSIIEAYSTVTVSEYPLVKIRRDAK